MQAMKVQLEKKEHDLTIVDSNGGLDYKGDLELQDDQLFKLC